ncbi:MAG: di/tricarboxylate transporter, partial [Candidatus Azotimanducaceae bacterium]
TLLLAIAERNGTIDWVVSSLLALAKGRLFYLPILLFITAFITSSLGPGAAPVLFVIGAGLIGKFGLNPLLIAAMVIHGTQSGAYSPIAPYGIVIQQLAEDQSISYAPWTLYFAVVGFHIVLALAAFTLLGGGALRGKVFASGVATEMPEDSTKTIRTITLLGFAALLLAVIGFGAHLGFATMIISFVLLLVSPKRIRSEAITRVAWPIVLVITGVLTYVNMISQAGAIDWLAHQSDALGSASLIALLLCYLVSIVTGVASTIGTIGMLVPLSAPLILSGDVDGTGLLTAMAVSAAISDISPFSTWGALFLASVATVTDRDTLLRKQLIYTGVLVTTLPFVAWLLFIALGILPAA